MVNQVYRGSTEAVRLLVEHGADVNAPSGKAGVTPLMIAAIHGNLETARFLLAHGASSNAKTASLETASATP